MQRVNQVGWFDVGNQRCFFRSKMEYRFACYLEWLRKTKNITSWEYEPKTFWFDEIKRGTVSYKPDFEVVNLDLSRYWVEVKGYMDKRSLTKIKRFRKYFPNETLIVIDSKWFKSNSKNLKGLIPQW